MPTPASRRLGRVPRRWGSEPENSVSLLFPFVAGLGSHFGGPLDHQASAWVGCLSFGGARSPEPPLRSAPARWYFADTPALAGPGVPGYVAGRL